MNTGGRTVPLVAGCAVASSVPALAGVLQGWRWLGLTVLVIALIALAGALVRTGGRRWWIATAAQVVVLLTLLAALFSEHAVFGALPGPGALADLVDKLGQAGQEFDEQVPPVPESGPLTLLVCLVYGVLSIVADGLAAAGYASAACGLVLLCAYTVSTSLAPDALPDWTLASGAAGFAVLLVADHQWRQRTRGLTEPNAAPTADEPGGSEHAASPRSGRRPAAAGWGSGLPVAIVVTACALAVALPIGTVAVAVGTEGRFLRTKTDGAKQVPQFGLDPFSSLRGQLSRPTPTELLRVRGLPGTTYLRSLTLSVYQPNEGWQLPRRRADAVLDRTLPTGLSTPVVAPSAIIEVDNVGYRDRWLPLAGLPLGVTGVTPGRWKYDVTTSTGYASAPVIEKHWAERAAVISPTADALNSIAPAADVDPGYLDTGGTDPRIGQLASGVTNRARTPFAKVAALTQYFQDPANGFRYDLRAPPGNADDDLVQFLIRGKVGYCEQFASAMAVMARAVGVPARVAIGFTPGREDAGVRSIGTADAHAWVEVFFAGLGWLMFDPTPLSDGRTVTPSYLTEIPRRPGSPPPSGQLDPRADGQGGDGAEPGSEFPPSGAGTQPIGGTPPPSGPDGGRDSGGADQHGASTHPGPASGDEWRAELPRAALLGLLLAFALLALLATPAMVRWIARRRRYAAAARGGPAGAAAAWRELIAEARDRGARPRPNSTVRSTARRLARAYRLDAESTNAVRALVGAVERGWYAPPQEAVRGGELVEVLRQSCAGLARASRLSIGERLWPRSVRPRPPRLVRTKGNTSAFEHA